MRINWHKTVMTAGAAGIFSALALDLTAPMAAMCALGAVDRILVVLFIENPAKLADELELQEEAAA